MFRHQVMAISVLSLVVMVQAAGAHAADACQPVFDALQKQVTTPSHSYTTSTAAKGGTPQTAETIMAQGKKYIRAQGKWMDARVTTQEVLEQEKENEKDGKSSCQRARSESVNGESALLYHLQRETEDFKEEWSTPKLALHFAYFGAPAALWQLRPSTRLITESAIAPVNPVRSNSLKQASFLTRSAK